MEFDSFQIFFLFCKVVILMAFEQICMLKGKPVEMLKIHLMMKSKLCYSFLYISILSSQAIACLLMICSSRINN